MKSRYKQRQQLTETVKGLEAMLLYTLGELKKEGWGEKRLQRLYDSVMLEMYKDVCLNQAGLNLGTGDTYARFQMDYSLDFEHFRQRQQETIRAFEEEILEKIQNEMLSRQKRSDKNVETKRL